MVEGREDIAARAQRGCVGTYAGCGRERVFPRASGPGGRVFCVFTQHLARVPRLAPQRFGEALMATGPRRDLSELALDLIQAGAKSSSAEAFRAHVLELL